MPKNNKFKYEFCPVCQKMSVHCPDCGGSTCNGNCSCEDTWEFYNNTETPPKPPNWKKQVEEYKNWLTRNFKEK